MSKINKIMLIISVVITSIFFASYIVPRVVDGNSTVSLHSLGKMYKSEKDLVRSSDVIIIGTILNVDNEYCEELSSSGSEPLMKISEISSVEIHKSLKGDLSKGDIIKVKEPLGYKINENEFYEKEIVRSNAKDRFIIFLVKDTDETLYHPISVIQGKIKLDVNKVKIDKNKFPMFKDCESIEDIERKIK